jgi:hypothetical protein
LVNGENASRKHFIYCICSPWRRNMRGYKEIITLRSWRTQSQQLAMSSSVYQLVSAHGWTGLFALYSERWEMRFEGGRSCWSRPASCCRWWVTSAQWLKCIESRCWNASVSLSWGWTKRAGL